MSLKQFIREHKEEINAYIKAKVGSDFIDTDNERKLWVLNDETLYNHAKSHGVKLS